jgi:integrase/recombinase XerD
LKKQGLVIQDSRSELQTVENNAMNIFENSVYIDPVEQYKLRLGSEASIRTIETRINECSKIWGCTHRSQIVWGKLTKALVMGLIKTMEGKGKKIATIKNTLSCLKGVVKEAYDLELIETEHYHRILSVRPPKGFQEEKGKALSSEQITELFNDLEEQSDVIGVRDNSIVKLLIGTGLRRKEITYIQIKDINFNQKTMLIKGKGNKERIVGLNKIVFDALEKWIEEYRGDYEGYLYSRIRKGGTIVYEKAISDQAIYNIVKARCKMVDITDIATHDLRRTFATYMLSQGIDILDVMKMMGHSSPETTKRYDKSGQNKALDIMKNMNF